MHQNPEAGQEQRQRRRQDDEFMEKFLEHKTLMEGLDHRIGGISSLQDDVRQLSAYTAQLGKKVDQMDESVCALVQTVDLMAITVKRVGEFFRDLDGSKSMGERIGTFLTILGKFLFIFIACGTMVVAASNYVVNKVQELKVQMERK